MKSVTSMALPWVSYSRVRSTAVPWSYDCSLWEKSSRTTWKVPSGPTPSGESMSAWNIGSPSKRGAQAQTTRA